jgi:DNA (cytosine-5)-methyltransferase 1
MRLLDLFCGAGGAAMGYHRAGFDEIVGVDHAPQPRYPFQFVQADALDFCKSFGAGFDAIHASPPCQHYSVLAAMHPEKTWPDLIPETRTVLGSFPVWVIENVATSPLMQAAGLFGVHGILLCGSSFGLGVPRGELRRHRAFESNVLLSFKPCRHRRVAVGVYGHGGHTGKHRMLYRAEAAQALEIHWMNRDEMC